MRERASAVFEAEFWPVYPKRNGSNPKQPAKQKFIRIVETGVDPSTIVDGARRYAASVAEADPRFTAQAITWLNQGRWNDDYTPASMPLRGSSAGTGPPVEDDWQRALRERREARARAEQEAVH